MQSIDTLFSWLELIGFHECMYARMITDRYFTIEAATAAAMVAVCCSRSKSIRQFGKHLPVVTPLLDRNILEIGKPRHAVIGCGYLFIE